MESPSTVLSSPFPTTAFLVERGCVMALLKLMAHPDSLQLLYHIRGRNGSLEQPILITLLIHLNPNEVKPNSGQQQPPLGCV